MPTADANTQISRTSYVNTWGTGWLHNVTIMDGAEIGYNSTEKRSYYFAAPCIEVEAAIKNRLLLGNSVNLNMKIYKYNGVGFEEVHNSSISVDMTSSDYHYRTFRHNCSSDGTYTDRTDTNLWKVELTWGTGEWPSRCAMKLYVRCGGIGPIPNSSTYNYMWKSGNYLYACEGDYWSTSSFSSDRDFISQKKPEAYSGQPISGATGYMAYSKKTGN